MGCVLSYDRPVTDEIAPLELDPVEYRLADIAGPYGVAVFAYDDVDAVVDACVYFRCKATVTDDDNRVLLTVTDVGWNCFNGSVVEDRK